MTQAVRFDSAEHAYYIGAWKAPVTVTEILTIYLNTYACVPQELMDVGADFGNALHDLNELLLTDTLDVDALDQQLVPYMNVLKKFYAAYDITGTNCDIEKPLANKRLGLGGKPDIVKHNNGPIFDIKSRKFSKLTDPLQLAAYDKMTGGNGNSREHYSVQILPDDYRAVKCNDKQAWPVFRNMLQHWHASKEIETTIKGWRQR